MRMAHELQTFQCASTRPSDADCHATKASRIAYLRDVVQLCREYGIPYCMWNYLSTPNDGNRFSLVDDDTRKFISPELLRACLGE